jgi:23S rRNA G2445 N2-methylase RlmL
MRLVVQMEGKHGYRRIDARKALARGLAGKLPASWQHVEENAAIEIWLTIHGASAVCGVRLSDRTMRHRTYKEAHRAASLRPTVAAAMVRLADVQPGQTVLDPMCGAGTILAEVHAMGRRCRLLGGDEDAAALRAANVNLQFERAKLEEWDARRLPLEEATVDRVICNLPFGKQLSRPELIGPLYRKLLPEFQRVLRKPGRAVLLAADAPAMQDASRLAAWKSERRVSVRILGQKATIYVYTNIV